MHGFFFKEKGEKDPKPYACWYEVVIKGLRNERAFHFSRHLLKEVVRYIGVPPMLQEFVKEAFGKAGSGNEIRRVLRLVGPHGLSSGPPQVSAPQHP